MFKIAGALNYLIVVFLNAFTDLGHKIIIQNTIFKVYDGDLLIVLTTIVNALILLPFILMFSPSGFLADRFAKKSIMEYSAAFAVVITLVITYAYYHGLFLLAFSMTFVLALQSALYGPAKYGYIKELFGVQFITGANGAVQAVTTVAILSGIIFYTVLFEGFYTPDLHDKHAVLEAIAPLGWLLVLSSVVEWFLASQLPNTMQEASKRTFHLKRYIRGAYLFKNLKTLKRKQEVYEAIIGLGLFWSISQVVLAIFGEYAKRSLGVSNTIFVQGVMALAGIGIVVGSLLAARYSKYFINMGLVSIGAFGVALLVFCIPFVHSMSVMAVMFMGFGIFAGFLMVPLNAQIQFLSPRVHLGTVIAGSNFIQNIFMFFFLVFTTLVAYFGVHSEYLFFMMGAVGVYLVWMLFRRYSVDTFWAIMEIIGRTRHIYRYVGLENVPQEGAVLLLGNHVSWLDWVVMQLPLKRRINFMMDKEIYHWWGLHAFFQKGETIPLSQKASKDAFQIAHQRLLEGKIVGLFPEGKISDDGALGKFYRGYEIIPKDYEGVIVPFFIEGMFGSMFSKYKPTEKKSFFKRRIVTVYYGEPVSKDTNAQELREIIQNLKEKYE